MEKIADAGKYGWLNFCLSISTIPASSLFKLFYRKGDFSSGTFHIYPGERGAKIQYDGCIIYPNHDDQDRGDRAISCPNRRIAEIKANRIFSTHK